MKKFFAMLLALSMALGMTACGGSSSSSDSDSSQSGNAASGDKVVRIGVFEPATGDSGAGGKQEMLGMQYANHITPTVDIGGETYQVELVYADNGSDSAKAPTAASELVSKDVSLVLGTYGSSSAIAGGPIFGEAGLAAIGVTCTNPNVTAGNDYYFRICFLDPFQGTVRCWTPSVIWRLPPIMSAGKMTGRNIPWRKWSPWWETGFRSWSSGFHRKTPAVP